MRKIAMVALVSALAGAAMAVSGALAAYWWADRHARTDNTIGWYAYRPRRYVDYLPPSTDWLALIVPAAIMGAGLALVVVGIARLYSSRRTRTVA